MQRPGGGPLRALVVSSSSPLPTTRGGNQRTNLLLRALAQSASVDLAYLHWDLAPPDPDLLDRLRSEFNLRAVLRPRGGPDGGPGRRLLWKSRALVRMLASRVGIPALQYARDRGARGEVERLLVAGDYDVVVVRYLLTAAVTRPFSGPPVILDADDFELTRYAALEGAAGVPLSERLGAKLALLDMRRRIPRLLQRCAHVWVPSQTEKDDIDADATTATVLPNVPFDPPAGDVEPAPESRVVLLVASLRYSVNLQAVDHFVRVIWPRVRERSPGAVARIVGAGMPESARRAWSAVPGVEPVGFVEDLAAEYARCLFTVAPMFHGGGTKIKVLESLAYRRACVTTAHAHAAFGDELPRGTALSVADSPADLAGWCITLLTDPALARAQADRGRAIVRERFSFDRFAGEVERTLREVTG